MHGNVTVRVQVERPHGSHFSQINQDLSTIIYAHAWVNRHIMGPALKEKKLWPLPAFSKDSLSVVHVSFHG